MFSPVGVASLASSQSARDSTSFSNSESDITRSYVASRRQVRAPSSSKEATDRLSPQRLPVADVSRYRMTQPFTVGLERIGTSLFVDRVENERLFSCISQTFSSPCCSIEPAMSWRVLHCQSVLVSLLAKDIIIITHARLHQTYTAVMMHETPKFNNDNSNRITNFKVQTVRPYTCYMYIK